MSTATEVNGVKKSAGLKFNPSTGDLTVSDINTPSGETWDGTHTSLKDAIASGGGGGSSVSYAIYTASFIDSASVIVRDSTLYLDYKQIEIDLSPYEGQTIRIANSGNRNYYGFTSTKPTNNTPLLSERQSTEGTLTYTYTGGQGRYLVYDFTSSNEADSVITVSVTPTLSSLSDVTLTSPIDGQVLTYDSTNNKWVNADGSTSSELSEITLSDYNRLTTAQKNDGTARFIPKSDIGNTSGLDCTAITGYYENNNVMNVTSTSTKIDITDLSRKPRVFGRTFGLISMATVH